MQNSSHGVKNKETSGVALIRDCVGRDREALIHIHIWVKLRYSSLDYVH